MNPRLSLTMREAMRLMQAGDLHAATAAIQQSLAATPAGPAARPPIDTQWRVEDAEPTPGVRHDDGQRDDRRDPGRGEFREHSFTCAAGTRRYKLFVPASRRDRVLPLLVMLHGCTQSPDDFARGTRMNDLAEEHGYCVAYPAQSPTDNATRCWNWFRPADQERDRGEPAILAALTRHLVDAHGLDAARVYIAGLSAGAAMAVILARAYPDVYAAVGVHSGLPHGAARDLPSALAAMKHGGGSRSAFADLPPGAAAPTIVFHGDRDTVVNAGNGDRVVAQLLPGDAGTDTDAHDAGYRQVERGAVPGGHAYTRTIIRDAGGRVLAEQWSVHGAGQAWCEGDASGSYTDPRGPDASAEMLRFFGSQARKLAS